MVALSETRSLSVAILTQIPPTVAPTPSIVTAQLSGSYTSFIVTFSEATNMQGVAADGGCEQLLTARTLSNLGSSPSPTCSWTSSSQLTVQLGGNPSIRLNTGYLSHDLLLLPVVLCIDAVDVTRVVALLDGVVASALESTAVDVNQTTTLSPPAVWPPVEAIISMTPNTSSLGPCDDLVLNASSSVGAAGRQLSFSWHLNASLSAVATDSSVLTIPSRMLSSVGTYIVGLSVSNWMGQSATSYIQVVFVCSCVLYCYCRIYSHSVSL